MLSRSTMEDGRFENLAAALLLAITVVLSLLLVRATGTEDVTAFLTWGSLGQEHGVVNGYQVMVARWPETVMGRSVEGCFYPPLGFAWLDLVCELADAVGISHFLGFKIALLVFGFVSTGMIWLFSRSIALAAAFQGATILSASGLGYMDVVTAPFLIGALWAIRKDRPAFGFVLFLVSILLKWQPLIIAPFLLLHVPRISDWRSIGRALTKPVTWQLGAAFVAAVLCVGAVFGAAPYEAFRWALLDPFLSGNTLNIPWVATFLARLLYRANFSIGNEVAFVTLPLLYLLPFKLIFFLLFAVILLRFIRVERTFPNFLVFSVLGVVTYGVWNASVHENHWFIALVPAFILAGAARDGPARWITILVAVMFNVNLFVFYGITGAEVVARNVGIDLSVILALLYAAIWLLLVFHAWSIKPVSAPLFSLSNRRDAGVGFGISN